MAPPSQLEKDVLADLRAHGPAVHPAGNALAVLSTRMRYDSRSYLSTVVRKLADRGEVKLDKPSRAAKRIYSIALPANGHAKAEVEIVDGPRRRPRNPVGAAIYDDVETAEIVGRIFPEGIPTEDPEQLAQDLRLAGTIRSRLGAKP